ncbi:MAG: leucine--tRNA ligase [Actinobacteria bacterium]|uniref:leucine--tRNA ligase n=1 Tax=freshwater metagenome TaxID=449393 RepID=A0A6J6F4M5_9ZZZZ|nr:leucine--tRNA ligase [Actinomycetota bacterium]
MSTASESPTSESQHAFRYSGALAQEIELRWHDWWDANGTFHTPNPAGPLGDPRVADQPKLFVLDMFPYPSGAGLHMGHPLGFTATDIYARYHRMTGKNVLYTMGFDAFGLPAEQYAVQTGQHPAITTDQNIANIRTQLRRLGLSHDPRRSISTTDPGYYRWTQWIFTQIFNSWYDTDRTTARPISELVQEFAAGTRATPDGRPWAELSASEQADVLDDHRLAYISEAPVNWCPGLGTVVANEEVTADGRSDRGNFPVFKRNMRQWMMRITAYADRLVDDLDLLDWTDSIKAMQRNWIGRSEGARVDFGVTTVGGAADVITVFTTRPDTLFGASFMVLAPEHPLVDALTTPEQAATVAEYRRQASTKSDVARQVEDKTKTGVFTGSYATNPINGEQIPVWIADYVLMGYGTGAIMAVPCGDERDFEFARQFGLPIPAIQQPPASWFAEHGIDPTLDTAAWPQAFVGDAPYVNSSNESLDVNGISDVATGKRRTNEWLEANGHGQATINYKLRDWLFSRQRYWGEPFPVVYDETGHAHTLPDELLPLELPPTDSFSPRTFDPDDAMSNPESPLDRLTDWVRVELDLGDGPKRYRRDTNVMPQWAGSCWYELRYCDPTNEDAFIDPEVERYWMGPQPDGRTGGVDLYVGGVEHAVLHLLYARFWHKVLFDLGHVSSPEPYHRLFNQGYILAAAFQDERGMYVDAFGVEERDGKHFSGGEPVTREYGKMGKSLKNAVAPDEVCGEYGADTLRLYLMSMGPLDASRPWESKDVVGMLRFLQRVWRNLVDEDTGALRSDLPALDDTTDRILHRTIDGVRSDLEGLRFNTAIAKLIELNNALTKLGGCPREIADHLVLMVAPFAPHLAEELWRKLGHDETVTYQSFPVADPAKLVQDTIELPVQINGKVRSRITVPAAADAAAVEAAALADEKVQASLAGATPKKVVVVPGRTVSLVV